MFRKQRKVKRYHNIYRGSVTSSPFFKAHFKEINRGKMLSFCRRNGISENVVFLTAFNYCIGLFSDEKDTVGTSIHSGTAVRT